MCNLIARGNSLATVNEHSLDIFRLSFGPCKFLNSDFLSVILYYFEIYLREI